jgi:Xaa-Pro aminopeptidase
LHGPDTDRECHQFGVRIKDLICVKEDGIAEVLNYDSKELEILGL